MAEIDAKRTVDLDGLKKCVIWKEFFDDSPNKLL
jgi:hypothetical protein